ncbi:MAG: YchJ family protein [Candidatus Thiodiazotropha sp. (ex Lucina aurantia)]|uniref:YchJ family protein n=1 Tax=Candidatus Thiodiazotropha taylori TaxID=2792791 RepID=A0A9E4TTT7_9GAMM|nr:YchJ family protein [Candidatus Thiodiazotropha sp. (ex Lucina pensylvanica)]MBT3015088.1 YchJ family protein [Candidatus Thiodiazotropha taylori]MBT3038299.1 YchJ family protein [Candidatus Thiodiazotropha sp. (ex Codakia orbicularis)]MBV2103005.1 YchJ family protein [Candidatus Thiodiazotropha sp. (ex Lucina aurantia)]MCG7861473.1 YchJ family protein [Candidatus Thiodiazotropha endolucinida]
MAGCYCGSGVAYESCCGPIHEGAAKADTAEKLMRARYSAFGARKAEFLHQSLHPDHRHDHDIEATRRWAENAEWLGLQIVDVQGGGEADEEGSVEFIATYKEGGMVRPHHEISRFLKQDGDWYFVDGQLVAPKTEKRHQPKVGRNDPCPCGSGKKYKKCCGV